MDDQDVRAELEIRRVLARYCRGVDRGDVEMLKSVYHEDASDDHGTFKGSGFQFAEMLVPMMDRSSLMSQHHVTNVLIERDGDVARVESYVLAFHPVADPKTGAESHALAGGRYLDRFERRAGEWKIADRVVVIDWTRTGVPGAPWPIQDSFVQGGRREEDPTSGLF